MAVNNTESDFTHSYGTPVTSGHPEVMGENAPFYHFHGRSPSDHHQPRSIYSYNMHHCCPSPRINQFAVPHFKPLPWQPVTSYGSNVGNVWCPITLPSLTKVHRPTPMYVSRNHWTPLLQGISSPDGIGLERSENPSVFFVTSQSSREFESSFQESPNKTSVIKHTAHVTSTVSTLTQTNKYIENEGQEKRHYKEDPIQRYRQPYSTSSSLQRESSDETILVDIKEEKVENPVERLCTSTTISSYNQSVYEPAVFEESIHQGTRSENGAIHSLPSIGHTSMNPIQSSSGVPKEVSAFQPPPASQLSLPLNHHQMVHDSGQCCSTSLPCSDTSTSNNPAPHSKSHNSKHVCDECGRSFTRSSTLVTHKRIHTGEKPFSCEICGRAFRQPGNLSRHRLTHTTTKPYVCPHCNKAFNRASNLHTHMRTHSDYKPYKCEFCDKRFHQKVDMKIHRYTHTGEKPHKCHKCGRGFKQLTHLTYHLRTHEEFRMYHCEFCGKGFNQKGNLQAHRYRHTGERPFKCDVCGKGFTLASTRNTHVRTHASKKPFECQHCDKAFYQKNALKTHYIASHPYADGVLIL